MLGRNKHFDHFTGFNIVGLSAIFLCLDRRIIIFPTPRGVIMGPDNMRLMFVCKAKYKS
jgi:hypothetical protein